MGKNKIGTAKGWEKFVDRLLSRKRADRRYKIPMVYIESLADRIHSTSPTKANISNMLKEFYCTTYEKAYFRSLSDRVFFKDRQKQHSKQRWNNEKDNIDDKIHEKSNLKK